MRATAIVNPLSGRRDVSQGVQAVARHLSAGGCDLRIIRTRDAGDARRIAAEVADDTRAVLAVGGDGTVRDVAAGLMGRGIPLAVLPAGTENIIARYFRMPAQPLAVAKVVLEGAAITHDVGMLGERVFMIVCGAGFDAQVVARLAARRRGHITHLDYASPIWRAFRQDRFPQFNVRLDDDEVFDGRGMVFVGVQPRYSLGLRVLARAVHDDGFLDVCVLPCDTKRSLVGHAVRTLFRRHLDRREVVYRKCRSVHLTSPEEVPIQCDGDPAGILPAEIGILSSAMRILVPRSRNVPPSEGEREVR